jgi:hypothetical protein
VRQAGRILLAVVSCLFAVSLGRSAAGCESRGGGREGGFNAKIVLGSLVPRQLLLRTALVSKLLSLSSPLSSLPAGMPYGTQRVFLFLDRCRERVRFGSAADETVACLQAFGEASG